MMRSLVLSFLVVVFFSFGSSALAAPTHDLALQSISFSKETMLAGERVRMYARVVNNGTEDEIAYVTFWQGGISVGNSQPVSLRAGGVPDEVFVDFTVPDQPFNIRAVVSGESVGDEDASNNEKVTPLITPLPDSDRDGVTDAEDNCPNDANPDQKNTDGDAEGDLCDFDDDNDGLSDVEETSLGTSTVNTDTDGDGVSDPDDAYPLDPSKSVVPPPPPANSTELEADGAEPVANGTEQIANNAELDGAVSGVTDSAASAPPPNVNAPQATLRPDTSIVDGEKSEAGFWSVANPYVQGLVGFLLLAGIGMIVTDRVIKRKYTRAMVLGSVPGNETASGSGGAASGFVAPQKPKPKKKKAPVKRAKTTAAPKAEEPAAAPPASEPSSVATPETPVAASPSVAPPKVKKSKRKPKANPPV